MYGPGTVKGWYTLVPLFTGFTAVFTGMVWSVDTGVQNVDREHGHANTGVILDTCSPLSPAVWIGARIHGP